GAPGSLQLMQPGVPGPASLARDTSASIQAKALLPDERSEICALRHAVLPRLVLRPAVERHVAPARRIARLVGMDRGAAAVVSIDALREIAFVVMSFMHRAVEGQPRADVALFRRPADTHPGDWN